MPAFRYRAVTREGQPTNGVITCDDQTEAETRLANRGLSQIHVQLAKLPKRREVLDIPQRKGGGVLLAVVVVLAALAGVAFLAHEMGWLDSEFISGLFGGDATSAEESAAP